MDTMRALRGGLALALLAGAYAAPGLAGASAPEPAPTASGALTGEAIYLRAVHAMRARPAPDFAVFREDVALRNLTMTCTADGVDINLRHGDQQRQYRVWFRSSDGETVTVEVPSGKRCEDAALLEPVAPPDDSHDLFGARPTPTPQPDLSVTSSGPPIIAAVRSEAAHNYRITLVDREQFEGHDVYRLALHPYRRSIDYPLTGLLVDADTWLVRQVTGEVSAHLPLLASGWLGATITFAQSGPWWVVRDEHFDMAGNALVVHARASVDVHADDYDFPKALPGVSFPTPRPKKSSKPS